MAKTVLELSTITERYDVTVNGAPYPLKSILTMNVLDFERIAAESTRASELSQNVTPEGLAELDAILDGMARFILDAPDEVHKALRSDQRMAIVNVFTSLLPESGLMVPMGARQEMTVSPSTGAGK